MASVIGSAKITPSLGGLKSAGKRSLGVWGWLAIVVGGAGLFLFTLPYLKRIPFLGGFFAQGASLLPGQSTAAASSDNYGRRMG